MDSSNIMSELHCVLLNSGGIDSRVTAKLAVDTGYTVHSFFVDANPKLKDVAEEAAAETARLYCADHFVYKVPYDWTYDKGDGIVSMPFTGMMLYTLGAQYASYKGWNAVFTGLRVQGTNPKRVEILNSLFADALNTSPVTFYAPLFKETFGTTSAIAKRLNVPLEDTFSCNQNPPCGKCRVCLNRQAVGLDVELKVARLARVAEAKLGGPKNPE